MTRVRSAAATCAIGVLVGAAAVIPTPASAAPGGWHGEPTMLSGTSRYDRGEWIHTDFVYDDGGRLDNAADIVDVRVRAEGPDLRMQVTLNSLTARRAPGLVVSVDTGSGTSRPWPHAPGLRSTWDRLYTVTPHRVLAMSSSGPERSLEPTVDLTANTIETLLPGAARTDAAQVVVAAGAWDSSSRTVGAGEAAMADLAFNSREAEPGGPNLRDGAQAAVIDGGDLDAMAVRIDVDRLRAASSDPRISTPGLYDRIYKSRQALGEGYGEAFPRFRGLYQPYALYLPKGWSSRRSSPLTLALHSLGWHHNQFDDPVFYRQVVERNRSIAITPLALGLDGWYTDEALVDTLEAWEDARRAYPVDDRRTVVSGFSMGGYGALRLASLLPDRFAALAAWAPPMVHTPTPLHETDLLPSAATLAANLEHVPVRLVSGSADDMVRYSGAAALADRLQELGYPHRFDLRLGLKHLPFTQPSDLRFEAAWLRGRTARVNPSHVAFTVRPDVWFTTADRAKARVLAGHVAALGHDLRAAHWVSGVVNRPGRAAVVDLASAGRRDRSATPRSVLLSRRLSGTSAIERGLDVRTTRAKKTANVLSGELLDVDELTVDLRGAGLRLDRLTITVESNRATTLHLVEGRRTRTVTLKPSA